MATSNPPLPPKPKLISDPSAENLTQWLISSSSWPQFLSRLSEISWAIYFKMLPLQPGSSRPLNLMDKHTTELWDDFCYHLRNSQRSNTAVCMQLMNALVDRCRKMKPQRFSVELMQEILSTEVRLGFKPSEHFLPKQRVAIVQLPPPTRKPSEPKERKTVAAEFSLKQRAKNQLSAAQFLRNCLEMPREQLRTTFLTDSIMVRRAEQYMNDNVEDLVIAFPSNALTAFFPGVEITQSLDSQIEKIQPPALLRDTAALVVSTYVELAQIPGQPCTQLRDLATRLVNAYHRSFAAIVDGTAAAQAKQAPMARQRKSPFIQYCENLLAQLKDKFGDFLMGMSGDMCNLHAWLRTYPDSQRNEFKFLQEFTGNELRYRFEYSDEDIGIHTTSKRYFEDFVAHISKHVLGAKLAQCLDWCLKLENTGRRLPPFLEHLLQYAFGELMNVVNLYPDGEKTPLLPALKVFSEGGFARVVNQELFASTILKLIWPRVTQWKEKEKTSGVVEEFVSNVAASCLQVARDSACCVFKQAFSPDREHYGLAAAHWLKALTSEPDFISNKSVLVTMWIIYRLSNTWCDSGDHDAVRLLKLAYFRLHRLLTVNADFVNYKPQPKTRRSEYASGRSNDDDEFIDDAEITESDRAWLKEEETINYSKQF
eukprot:TRINITY_DN521_c0_g1_i1.p1 TRINITY_DN521_c0_g1~~TRINITY_DN521_c0_g1_i1.p1  ORF type:complete len:653 (-),score=84.94 TRINITY_DN521_c0_g1_i1:3805-5763(-)